jgi:hypothetical protein
MDALEKARIRLEHWIEHNDDHQRDYETFAEELTRLGKIESAALVREVVGLNTRSTECLRQALQALEAENPTKE